MLPGGPGNPLEQLRARPVADFEAPETGALLGRIDQGDGFLFVLMEGEDVAGRNLLSQHVPDPWIVRAVGAVGPERVGERHRGPADVILDGGRVAIQIVPDAVPVLGQGLSRPPGW